MHHICLRPPGIIFQLAAISQELFKILRRSEVSSENLPKIEPTTAVTGYSGNISVVICSEHKIYKAWYS